MSTFLLSPLLHPPHLPVDHAVALLARDGIGVGDVGVVQAHLRRLVLKEPLEISDRSAMLEEIGTKGIPRLVRMDRDSLVPGEEFSFIPAALDGAPIRS
jgi:hypothetical protein